MNLFYRLSYFFIKKFGNQATRQKVVFDHHFFVNKYYLNKNASLHNIIQILNTTEHELERLLHTHYALNFTTLCDMYRFKHFWEEFTNPLNAELSVKSIIELCGFNSNDEFNDLLSGHKEASKDILKRNFS